MRHGIAARSSASAPRQNRGNAAQAGHSSHPRETQVLNGRWQSPATASQAASAAIGQCPDSAVARTDVSEIDRGSSSVMLSAMTSRLKNPKFPIAWIAIISPVIAPAARSRGQPAKNTRKGRIISVAKSIQCDQTSSGRGSRHPRQPSGDGIGWLIRKDRRYRWSPSASLVNLFLPNPNRTRNSSHWNIHIRIGSGLADIRSAGSRSSGGSRIASSPASNSIDSHGKVRPTATSRLR